MASVKTLGRLQKIREYKKEEIEIEFKKVLLELRRQEEELDALHSMMAKTIVRMNEKQIKGFSNVYELSLYYDYIETLNKFIDKQKIIVSKLTELFEEKKSELLEAYKEVKTIEILKDKIISDERKNEDRRVQKELDYVYLSRLPRD
ncbi:MAG: flagellar export protein FliJ [Nitrospirae bacterium]|nr:flagellar export protein FliJ [Nitrospirota bacterium]